MSISNALLAGLVVLAAALGWKTRQLGGELTEHRRVTDVRTLEAQGINRGLVERIHVLRPPPFSLVGLEATSGEEFTVEEVDSLVVYLFGASCPFSPLNVPFLNRLHERGVPVVGIAPDALAFHLRMFAHSAGTAFPVVSHSAGGVVDILPRGRVPLTAVFVRGRLESLWLGELSEDRRESLLELFRMDRRGE